MPQFTKQSSRPLTTAGIKTRAKRMREQCDAIHAYADAIEMGDMNEMLPHWIERTAKRLSYAALDVSNRLTASATPD